MISGINLGHLGADLSILRCKENASGGHLPLKKTHFFTAWQFSKKLASY
jgi:hypothetical protein